MNDTTNAGEPSYTTIDTGNKQGGVAYDVAFSLVILVFIIILICTSFICKRTSSSRSTPELPIASFPTIADSDTDDDCSKPSNGLNNNVLSTFPTFLYSEAVKNHDHDITNGMGCSICLAEYKPTDVIRLLPTCGHLFHVTCVDTWLKVHPTCPVCRKSPLPELT